MPTFTFIVHLMFARLLLIEVKAYALWECKDAAEIAVGSRLKGLLYKVGPAVLHHLGSGKTLQAIGHTGACSAAHCRKALV
jgi:hypothetical protein